MQSLSFSYPTEAVLRQPVHVGVVASGDLEIVVTPDAGSTVATVDLRTSVDGFDVVWQQVLDRFFAQTGAYRATYRINDFGATPGMVSLRLAQAAELAADAATRENDR